MDCDKYPENINELEYYLDEVFCKLKVYQLPFELALIVALTIFEDKLRRIYESKYDQFSTRAAISYQKAGIQILIPQIFRRCTSSVLESKKIEVTEEIFSYVAQALEFCQRYSAAIHTYTQFHQEWLVGKLSGRIAQFSYAETMDFGRAQLNLMLHKYHEEQILSNSVKGGKIASLRFRHKSVAAKLEAIQCTDINKILYIVPNEIYSYFHDMAEATIAKPTLDEKIKYHNYTVGEYYRFWIEFATLMAIYQESCRKRTAICTSFNFLQNAILQFNLPQLAKLITSRVNFTPELAKFILTDIILDVTNARADLLVQPLVPIPDQKIVVVSPALITTSNWEVCLLRNWSRYPDIYGDIVASKKNKLADQLANLFDSNRFRVSKRRKLYDGNNQIVGDVDLAVFDPTEGLLVLFELKWLIEPDSTKETIRTYKELSKGIEQLLKVRSEFERNASIFLKRVFPNNNIEVSAVRDMLSFVIGHGDVGIKDDNQNKVFILDYLLASEIIARAGSKSLRNIIADIIHQQTQLSNSASQMAGIFKFKLAGFLFCQPGYGTQINNIPSSASRMKLGRNDFCLCGSGLKYKKCCWEIANYDEHII